MNVHVLAINTLLTPSMSPRRSTFSPSNRVACIWGESHLVRDHIPLPFSRALGPSPNAVLPSRRISLHSFLPILFSRCAGFIHHFVLLNSDVHIPPLSLVPLALAFQAVVWS